MRTLKYNPGSNDITWVVTKDDNGNVSDVSVHLTKADYLSLLEKLPDPHSTYKNTSCVNLFKNGLAKAREKVALDLLETSEPKIGKEADMNHFLESFDNLLSSELIKLDQFINADINCPEKQINALTQCLESFKKKINQDPVPDWIINSSLSLQQKKFVWEDFNQLILNLNAGIARFEAHLNALGESPSSEDIKLLLSPQDRDKTGSLGNFLANQTTAACLAAEKITGIYFRPLANQGKKQLIGRC
jgi:hypothetical protein